MSASTSTVEPARLHRRRASHLYGLIISGSVLAAAPVEFGLGRVAAAVVLTLTVYWVAESYAHWIAARTVHGRDLTRDERRTVLADGLPLVASCLVPVGVLVVEALLGMQTATGVDIALAVNVVLLVGVGWRMGLAGGLRGVRLLMSAVVTGMLGAVMIALKHGLH
ncbi:MAG: hypothetical protein NVV70_15040 [Cellulomonas sp.]|uniref:Integral membrane protein n=1 Tax=Cellulomonas gelida TaxID=1712 RepID=A0A4Y3KSU9_9CELL|nr:MULTISPECIES: hypothetical protein [Cellulomonas]KMM45952.1 hypothetical protein CWIS_07715 [Cellulomonas sp. A375-1]MCR6649384.1 hypothetical protein [Cellulomonas sp.]MCR6705360.1 hypothetical protein [Cellulomonas sp.]GEA86000.1 hypothetical protein CGE01nite_32510 [Cellulomonas gelida]GGL18717.1 hypothetical protein GCM10009774_06310 [Cellulomonas gelida]